MSAMTCACEDTLSADTSTTVSAEQTSAVQVEQVDPATEDSATWSGPIGLEGLTTGDGRTILPNALRWDTLPVPLRWAREDYGEHDGAVVVGKITSIERDENNQIIGIGEFDLGSENGREAYRQVREGLTPGVSMDLDDIVIREEAEPGALTIVEGRVRAATIVAIPAFEGARISVSSTETFTSETFNWVDDVGGLPPYIKRISKHLKKKGMTESHAIATAVNVVKKMCATGDVNFPGKQDVNAGSRAEACAAVADWEAKKAKARASAGATQSTEAETSALEGIVTTIEGDFLTAAATVFDAAWFDNPRLTKPTPLTVTEDGRVFGHIALWGTCHIANPQGADVCTQPPRSPSNYAYFKTGAVSTTKGDIAVGKITMSTVHAGPRLSSASTMRHYEDTGTVGAFVNAGEDSVGIWVAGAARPDTDHTSLKGAPVSGDWRSIGGHLEMVGALSVNVPGFPVPRPQALVAGGATLSLVASGVVLPEDNSIAARMRRRREARALNARIETLAKTEKVRRLARATFAYNPDQWRVPKGNGKLSGRFVDMPGVGIDALEGFLMDLADSGDLDENVAADIGEDLGSAVEAGGAIGVALRNNDGDGATALAKEVSGYLDSIENKIEAAVSEGSLNGPRINETQQKIADARESVDVVADSDLSLLGDEGFDGDAPDMSKDGGIGSEDAPDAGGDIGAEPAAGEAAPTVQPAGTVVRQPGDPMPTAQQSEAFNEINSVFEDLADGGAFDEDSAEQIGLRLDDLANAMDDGDEATATAALEALESQLASAIDGGADIDDDRAETIGNLIDGLSNDVGATEAAPAAPDAPDAPDEDGDVGADLANELGDLADSGRITDDVSEALLDHLDALGAARESGDPEQVERVLADMENTLTSAIDSGDLDVDDNEADRLGQRIEAISQAEGTGAPDGSTDPESVGPLPSAEDTAPPAPQGSPQQQAGASTLDAGNAVESEIMAQADAGAFDDDAAERVGEPLGRLMEELDALNSGVQEGSGAGDIATAQAALDDLESQLMGEIDAGANIDDDAAAGLGDLLESLRSELDTFAGLMTGSTEPPPFSAETKAA